MGTTHQTPRQLLDRREPAQRVFKILASTLPNRPDIHARKRSEGLRLDLLGDELRPHSFRIEFAGRAGELNQQQAFERQKNGDAGFD